MRTNGGDGPEITTAVSLDGGPVASAIGEAADGSLGDRVASYWCHQDRGMPVSLIGSHSGVNPENGSGLPAAPSPMPSLAAETVAAVPRIGRSLSGGCDLGV